MINIGSKIYKNIYGGEYICKAYLFKSILCYLYEVENYMITEDLKCSI